MIFKKTAELIGHQHPIYVVENSFKEHIVFTAGGEGAVVEWSLKKRAFIKIMFKMNASIYCLHSVKNPNVIIAGDRSGLLNVFDFEQQKVVYSTSAHTSAIFDIQSNANYFYSTGEDGYLNTYEFENYQLVNRLKISNESLRTICIVPLQNKILLAGKDQRIYSVDLLTQNIQSIQSSHTLGIFSSALTNANKNMITGSRDAQMKIWDTQNLVEIKNIAAHMYAINDIQVIESLGIIATASMDKSIKIWDEENFNLKQILDLNGMAGHHKSINSIAFTTFENTLLSVGDDRKLIIWNA